MALPEKWNTKNLKTNINFVEKVLDKKHDKNEPKGSDEISNNLTHSSKHGIEKILGMADVVKDEIA
jgi:hypothetical protein